MRKATSGLTPEGIPSLLLTSFGTLAFAIMGCWVVSTVFFTLFWFSLHFFRDPERVTPTGEGLVVSAADGKVIKITPMEDPFTGERRMCICVFMNVFSVHVNRSPMESTVRGIKYFSGKYFNAAWDKASTDNERCAYDLEHADGSRWTMVQIAGLVARRIVCRVDEGDALTRGERYGMIKFGSRVDLYLPEGYAPSVTVGEQVFAGETVIASKNEKEDS